MHQHGGHGSDVAASSFPTGVEGLPEAGRTAMLKLADGEVLDLRLGPVVKRLADATVRMLAYNGSIPGPTVRVRQGSQIVVQVTNDGDMDTTVHWHGLRLENKYDGVPHETQLPIPMGGSFSYRLKFPDAGLYWYHPHIREDYGQELGLYGNIIVDPAEPDYWPPVHREIVLTLDDLLLEGGKIAPFSRSETNYTAMGRFGNVLLIGGEPDLALSTGVGEVVRLYLTNTANTRVFNVALPGARMKLVGGDSGRYEREEFVEQVLLAPSERAVVDVLFDQSGQLALEHRTPNRTYTLATISVGEDAVTPPLDTGFEVLRSAPELVAERQRLESYLAAPPDKTLALVAEMDDPTSPQAGGGPAVYACPMHPEVTSPEPGRCPKCGMKLLATAAPAPTTYACPMHPEVTSDQPGRCPKCGMKLLPAQVVTQPGGHDAPTPTPDAAHGHDHHSEEHDQAAAGMQPSGRGLHHDGAGHSHDAAAGVEHAGQAIHDHAGQDAADGIEWEDDMVEVNRLTTTANMRWKFVDRTAGSGGAGIDWRFTVGDRVKIRLVNEMDSDHPMHHPFHLHGAGRFLVLARDGGRRAEPGLEGHGRWSGPGRRWTSCSTSPSRACGWRTATSPSTCKAG